MNQDRQKLPIPPTKDKKEKKVKSILLKNKPHVFPPSPNSSLGKQNNRFPIYLSFNVSTGNTLGREKLTNLNITESDSRIIFDVLDRLNRSIVLVMIRHRGVIFIVLLIISFLVYQLSLLATIIILFVLISLLVGRNEI